MGGLPGTMLHAACLKEKSLVAGPRSGDDLAQLLMEKAVGDEKILLRLIDKTTSPTTALGFTPSKPSRR